MKNFLSILNDFFLIQKGKYNKKKSSENTFAFLVHSRSYKDIYRKYPIFRYIPESIGHYIINHLWPITLSQVTGVKSVHTKQEIRGYVLGITMTAEYMMSHRKKALKKIRDALYLARGKGINIVGLGGLTSSLSGGGTKLLDIPINITTGHAYTAFNVTQTLLKIHTIIGIPKIVTKIAIVGAAGSVGSMSALILARDHFPEITLVDLSKKQESLNNLVKQIRCFNSNIIINISNSISDIQKSDLIITATNAAEALITPNIVKEGMIFVDDAQPSDIHPDVLKMENVLVLEAGIVDTPGINSNFNYGLKSRTDNFCCMAELLILASNEWNKHYVIDRATIEHVDSISAMGYNLGFQVASFQNFLESISEKKINHIREIIRKKYALQS